MKQIVFVTGSMGRGGAERVISILSERYVRYGWHVRILMLLHSNVEYALDPSVEVVDLSNDKKRAVLAIPGLIRKVRAFVKREKPDVVVAFMAPICLVTGLACCSLPVRLITSERIDPAMSPRNMVFKAVLNYVYAHSSATVLQTQRARQYFSEKIQKNSVVIPNPVQVKAQAEGKPSHRIVTAGRLTPQKNHRLLLNAFADFYVTHPEYRLDIYGEGPLRGELQDLINSLGLADVARLMGNVPNLHEQIADAEMFVLSSDFEGLSNALLEAMMMGLPCISTNCAGSDEAIASEKTGLLTPVGDKEALTAAMVRLADDPFFAKEIAVSAKRDVELRYSVDQVIDQWKNIIEGEKD